MALSILPVNTLKGTVSKAAEKESNYVVMADNKEDLDEAKEICQDEFQAEELAIKENVSDFAPTNGYRNAGIDWLVQNLYENASYHDSTIANRLKAYSCQKK